jgi:hypothetical protein
MKKEEMREDKENERDEKAAGEECRLPLYRPTLVVSRATPRVA